MPIQADYIMLFKYGQNPASLSFTFVLFKQFSEKKFYQTSIGFEHGFSE